MEDIKIYILLEKFLIPNISIIVWEYTQPRLWEMKSADHFADDLHQNCENFDEYIKNFIILHPLHNWQWICEEGMLHSLMIYNKNRHYMALKIKVTEDDEPLVRKYLIDNKIL